MQLLIIAFVAFSFSAFASTETAEDLLQRAHAAYKKGERDTAKALYLDAAELGNAEANYAFAYQYGMLDEERLKYYRIAAQQGHEQALRQALNILFYRTHYGSPKQAFDLWHEAMRNNPAITVEHPALEQCIEAGTFNMQQFIEQHDLEKPDETKPYYLWELAEDATNSNRFGAPSNLLALQLICHGGQVPFEMRTAVAEAFKHWKEDTKPYFDLCEHVTSRFGMRYCMRREP